VVVRWVRTQYGLTVAALVELDPRMDVVATPTMPSASPRRSARRLNVVDALNLDLPTIGRQRRARPFTLP
jgi:hypothetical protein